MCPKSRTFTVQAPFQRLSGFNGNDPLVFILVPLKCRQACLCKMLFTLSFVDEASVWKVQCGHAVEVHQVGTVS